MHLSKLLYAALLVTMAPACGGEDEPEPNYSVEVLSVSADGTYYHDVPIDGLVVCLQIDNVNEGCSNECTTGKVCDFTAPPNLGVVSESLLEEGRVSLLVTTFPTTLHASIPVDSATRDHFYHTYLIEETQVWADVLVTVQFTQL